MSQLSDILGGGSLSGGNNQSIVARLGQLGQKYTDPLAWIFGRKYTDKLVDVADFSNKQFSSIVKPFSAVDKELNPLRRFNVVPAVNNLKEWTEAKPADTAAIAAGAYFGAGALGGLGSGSTGGASGAGGGTGLGGAGIGSAAADGIPTVTITGSSGFGAPAYFAGGAGAAGANSALTNQTSSDLWNRAFQNSTNFGTGAPTSGSAMPGAGIGGIAGPVGGGTGASSAAGIGPMGYAKLGLGAAGALQPQGQQAQQPPPQAPVRNMAQPSQVPTFGQRVQGGLGRVGETLFPIDPNTGMTPDQQKALRTNAMIQMGLGMMAASSKGQGLGASVGAGFSQAQGNVQGAMQQAYENAMRNRAETRAVNREERDDARLDSQQAHQQWLDEHTLARETTADARYTTEQDRQAKQDEQAQKRWETEQRGLAQYRQSQTDALDRPQPGYRWADTTHTRQEFIPGGSADPAVSNARNAGISTEDERKSAGYAVRMENALNTLTDIAGKNPNAQRPDVRASVAGAVPLIGGVLENSLNPTDRQRAMAAQRDALDAALTLATGAAYTKQQFEDLQKSYFPQIGDDEATVKEKRARFDLIIQTARIRAGRAASTIDPLVNGTQPQGGGLGSPMQAPNGMQIYPNSQATNPNQQRALAQRAQGYY